jgi:ABC-type lipoprotein release transport system permease subunit
MADADGAGERPASPGRAAALLLRLAWRNLWRNPRRSLLTLSAVAFAAAILVFMVALQLGAYGAMIESAVGVFQGHLQVQVAGYREKPRLRTSIEGAPAVAADVAAVPGVEAVALRAQAAAMVSSPARSYGAQVVGVEPAREPEVSTLPGLVRRGRFLAADDAPEAVVGETLARNLSLAVGDEVTVLGQGRDGSLAVAVLEVVGVFESGVPELDRRVLEMPLKTFQEVFAMPGEAHAVVVKTRDLEAVEGVAAAVRRPLADRGGLAVLTWDELMVGIRQAIALDMAVGWFLYAALVVVVTFSILNTFLMAVLERTRELGVLLALGTRPGFLGRLLVLESLLLLLLGLALGILLGAAVAGYFSLHGLAFPGSEELFAQWHLPARWHPRINLLALTAGPAAILATTLIAALFPLLRVRRLRPTEAMRAV